MAIEFLIPKEYQAPDGVKEGETFKELAVFSFDKGGKMKIHAIGEKAFPIETSEKKPKGAQESIREQLAAMEDKKGSAQMGEEGE
jgi:hypothetical protein